MDAGLLTNRELATLVWLAALVIYVAFKGDPKGIVKPLRTGLRLLLSPRAFIPLVAYMAWLVGAVWLGQQILLWQPALLKPTVAWALFSGIGLYFGFTKALEQKSFLKEAVLGALGATLLVEYWINFASFPFVVELVLQPVAILALAVGTYAMTRREYQSVVKLCNWILVGVGALSLAWVLWNLVVRWSDVDLALTARELILPVWLTPAALVFVYLLAMYAGYEQAFTRISWRAENGSPWKVKFAFMTLVGLRLRKLREFDGGVQLRGASESSVRTARSAMKAEVGRRKKLLEPNIEPAPPGVEQIEWSVLTKDGLVTLKGDLPNGYPTETWINDRLIDRDPGGDFSWDLQASLPSPVALIQHVAECQELMAQSEFWKRGASNAPTEDSQVRQRAFAQAACDRAAELDCLKTNDGFKASSVSQST
jgi:hypothetical protein